MAKMSPNGRSWGYQICSKEVLGNLPSISPESLWDSFKAGNLKKMKMYIEPSKMLAVTPRAKSRLSAIHKNVVYVVYGFTVQHTFNKQSQSTLWSCAIPLDVQN
jgi:predicted transcriptional regulator